jgi:hypothetical protein
LSILPAQHRLSFFLPALFPFFLSFSDLDAFETREEKNEEGEGADGQIDRLSLSLFLL